MTIQKTAEEYYREAEETADMQEAFRALMNGFVADNRYHPLYQLAAQLLRSVGGHEEAVLFEQAVANFQGSEPFFDLGYHFAEVHNWALAETFLARAYQLTPDNHSLVYEYTYAMMHNFKFEEARQIIETIDFTQDFWLAYRYFYCVILLNQQEKLADAKAFLREIRQQIYQLENPSEDDKYALHKLGELQQIIQRLEMLKQPQAHIRDWHFIQYGGTVLSFVEQDDVQYLEAASGRFVGVYLSQNELMRVCYRLVKLLKNNSFEPNCVLFTPEKTSEIIARCIAHSLGCSIYELTEDNQNTKNALIVSVSAEKLSAWTSLSQYQAGQRLFAFSLDWTKQPFVLSEAVGMLAQYVLFPWEEGIPYAKEDEDGQTVWENSVADSRSAEAIAAELIALKLEADTQFEVHEKFYEQHKNGLLFTVTQGSRPIFVRESPMKGKHF